MGEIFVKSRKYYHCLIADLINLKWAASFKSDQIKVIHKLFWYFFTSDDLVFLHQNELKEDV